MRDTATRSERLPFDAFLEVLVSNGFEIGVEQRARLHRLLEDLGPEFDPHRLKTILCPLFASSDSQQETFHRLFEQFFPELVETEQTSVGPVAPLSLSPRRRRNIWLIVIANLIWLGILAYTGYRVVPRSARPSASRGQSGGPGTSGGSQVEPVFPRGSDYALKAQPAAAFTVKLPTVLLRMAPYLLVLALVLFEFTSWLRREAILNRAPRREPPSKWPLAPDPRHAHLYRATQVTRIARRLRARETVESDEVDMPATISRTLRSLGFVKFAFRLGSKRPEYLALIERQSSQDHMAALFLELTESLRKEGVLLDVYFYEGDAQVCHAATDNSPLFLDDLCSRFRDRRVIVFGDGREFSNPYSVEPSRTRAALRSFRACALLSPTVLPEKTRHERGLDETFAAVLPAGLNGLSALSSLWGDTSAPAGRRSAEVPTAVPAEWDDLRWEKKLPGYITSLREYLGYPLFRWLCACALHSQLHWELSLALGAVTSGRQCDEANVLRLFQLKWFRLGAMPLGLRDELTRELDRSTEKSVRAVVLDFLKDHPAPKGSFAETIQKSEVAGHEWQLSPAQASRIKENRELTQLLAESSPKIVGRVIPRAIREWFFRQSVPAFGLRASSRAVLAVASVALVGISIWSFASIAPIREWSQYRMVLGSPRFQDTKKCTAHPPRFRTASGYVESGSQYFEDNNFACSIDAFSFAISLDPDRPDALVGRAASTLRSEANADPPGARQDLETAIRLNPKISRAYYWRGWMYEDANEHESALIYGKKAAQLDPADAYPHYLLGTIFKALKRFDEATSEYTQAIRLDPTWALPYNGRGDLYFGQGKYGLAVSAYRDAIRIDPYFTAARNNLARALDRQNKFDEAIEEATTAIRINPGSREAYLVRADTYDAKGDYRAAVADADYVVQHSPDADAFVNRGFYYKKLGDPVRAIADYSEAIRRLPDYDLAYLDRGYAYLALGRQGEAITDFRRVLELPGSDEWKQQAQEQLKTLGLR